jgi:multidrug efflux system outer membrane protein
MTNAPMRMTSIKLRLSTLAIAVPLALAAGCATPSLHPQIDVPPRFAQSASAEGQPEAAWWDSYRDPVLASLIRKAAYENRDVKMAAERVRAARAGEKVSRSWLFPQIGASAGGFDLKNGYDTQRQQAWPELKSGSAALDVSWEVDLSGRLRAGAAASKAEALAAEDTARGVRLLVLTDVATNYFTLVGAMKQLDTVRAISAAQDETLRLVQARERAGLATPFDVERAQTDASRAHAAIPPLETLAAVSRHRIAVLIGDQAFNASGIVPYTGPTAVPATRAGQPATLLQRRPDVLAAQAQLEAANARRQQAAAEWFPRLFLGAAFGRESVSVNGASLGAARYTNAAALLAMPIFNAGRTQAINDMAESTQKEAAIRYESAMVSALEDVENALVTLGSERERATSLHASAQAAVAALGHARSLYQRGQIDLLPLLDAQRAELTARLGANDSDTQLLLDSVQLYKALGGGWEVFETDPKSKT